MKKEIEIYTEINPSELAKNKIWVDVQPIDDWDHWMYTIYFEDVMSPFYKVHANGFGINFKSYSEALRDAYDWLSVNGYISKIGLPF